MKKNSKNLIVSLITVIIFSFLFIFSAGNKTGVTKFDLSLGAVWIFFLSFIIILSLTQKFKSDK